MQAHRVEATIDPDGSLKLDHLPFRAGEAVEIIILSRRNEEVVGGNRYPLRGMGVRYDRPFDPVAVEDWDALR